MGRKVINKYFPPDFDPTKLAKAKTPSNQCMKVRMMMCMSVQCLTCGNFISKGTKFNMRKEDVLYEDYLGIHIYRFYFKCPSCSSEITFKSDPKNCDYVVEYGALRTAEPWKTQENDSKRNKFEEDKNITETFKGRNNSLEIEKNSTANIEEMRIFKGKHERLGIEAILNAVQYKQKKKNDSDIDNYELKKMLDKKKKLKIHGNRDNSTINEFRVNRFDSTNNFLGLKNDETETIIRHRPLPLIGIGVAQCYPPLS